MLLWAAAAAAPASATDVTFFQGQELKITGAPGESSRLSVRFFPDREASVHDDAGTLRPGLGCLGTFYDVSCPQLLPLQQCHPCSVSIDLADHHDTLALAGESQKSPFTVNAGAGDDDVRILADTRAHVDGGPGRDRLRADTYSELDGGDGAATVDGSPADAIKCGPGSDVAHGLAVPGAYGDCEWVFSSSAESPYLTVSDIRLRRHRQRVTLGWHRYPPPYPGAEEFPESASGIVEVRYRGRLIGRGAFAGASRPAPSDVALRLNARGKALACRSARRVRLLVVATSARSLSDSRSAVRRDARLPRAGTCAKKKR